MLKIYTYYEDINFPHQLELLELWKESWQNAQMTPIILTRSDAEQHPYYLEFMEKINSQHLKITQKPLSVYGLSCWLRWMAYANQNDEYFYVSDYDVINVAQLQLSRPSTEYICLLDDCCPCFVTGFPKLFNRLIHYYVSISDLQMQKIIESNTDPCYHDQNFFVCNRQYIIDHFNHEIKLSRDRSLISPPFDNNGKKSCAPIIHFSHEACQQEENRIKMIKEFLHR